MSNFHPFEVVARSSETQLQVAENLNYLLKRLGSSQEWTSCVCCDEKNACSQILSARKEKCVCEKSEFFVLCLWDENNAFLPFFSARKHRVNLRAAMLATTSGFCVTSGWSIASQVTSAANPQIINQPNPHCRGVQYQFFGQCCEIFNYLYYFNIFFYSLKRSDTTGNTFEWLLGKNNVI